MQRLIFATVAAMLLAPIAFAQNPTTPGLGAPAGAGTGSTSVDTAPLSPNLTRASRVLRQNVYNPNGDMVGSIDDLIIDPHSGQIQQVVIGVGGFLGIGEKRVAVPFNELTLKEVAMRTPPSPAMPGSTAGPPAGTATAPGSTAGPPVDTTRAPGSTAVPPVGTATAPGGTAVTPAGTPVAGAARPPERFTVNRTRDELKAAPEYNYTERR